MTLKYEKIVIQRKVNEIQNKHNFFPFFCLILCTIVVESTVFLLEI